MIIFSNTENPCVDQYRVLAQNRKGKHVLFQGQL